jgi:hypothetical protein
MQRRRRQQSDVEGRVARAIPARASAGPQSNRQADEAGGVMETMMNESHHDRRVKLLRDVAVALSHYFDNHLADCHAQAVRMLVKAGPLRGHARRAISL